MIPFLEVGLQILNKIIPDPSERAKAQAMLIEAQNKGEFKELDSRMQAIVMEAQSADPWTSRARPSFLYVMYVMILGAIPMGFLFALEPELSDLVIKGFKGWLKAIPTELWALFGAGYLGYVNKRSEDKAVSLGAETKQGIFSKLFG